MRYVIIDTKNFKKNLDKSLQYIVLTILLASIWLHAFAVATAVRVTQS